MKMNVFSICLHLFFSRITLRLNFLYTFCLSMSKKGLLLLAVYIQRYVHVIIITSMFRTIVSNLMVILVETEYPIVKNLLYMFISNLNSTYLVKSTVPSKWNLKYFSSYSLVKALLFCPLYSTYANSFCYNMGSG